MSKVPLWLAVARQYDGTKEWSGPATSPTILRWLTQLGAWWRDDETPWCGVFVGAVLKESGYDVPKTYFRAKSWASWGQPLANPAVGGVAVFEREGGGHVAFIVGKTPAGQLLCLGGNQSNQVCVRAFDPARVVALRWPATEPLPQPGPLPVQGADLSRSEA